MAEIEEKIKEQASDAVLAPNKNKKKSKLEEKANESAGVEETQEIREEKEIPVAEADDDFEEFAPVDLSELGN